MNLDDPQWGEVKLLVAKSQTGEPWGVLAPLKDTQWGELVSVVTGSAFSDAMHGDATRLMREIGAAPRLQVKTISEEDGVCRNCWTCPIYRPHCRPGKKLPDCYEAPGEWDPVQSSLITYVALALSEDRYVMVVEGNEWSVR